LYRNLHDGSKSLTAYVDARSMGLGTTLEQRNAYIAALNGLARYAAAADDENALRELIVATRKDRDPRDAWALGNLAESLVGAGMFTEAIDVARDALRVMNYGIGRLTLTAALFGKAAELTVSGKNGEAAPLVKEARDYGYARSSVLGEFDFSKAKAIRLRHTLLSLVE
jgi:tetratricopeptide (TPR) repeat protein